MRKTARNSFGALAILLGALLAAPTANAQPAGAVPDAKVCKDKENPPKDAATKGGCVVLDRKKGNCMACHAIAGTTHGNIAPPLVQMQQRFPDKVKLRAQVHDARSANPRTSMPPYGAHGILSKDEVDQVVEFLLTL